MNDYGDGGYLALASMLSWEHLALKRFSFGNITSEPTSVGLDAMTDGLKAHPSLEGLKLYEVFLREYPDSIRRFTDDVVRSHPNLVEISLSDCLLTDEMVEWVAVALPTSRCRYLFLCGTLFGDAGARALANALRRNRTLLRLNLMKNEITDAGAAELADALEVSNYTLQRIELTGNYVSDAETLRIARIIAANQQVKRRYDSLNDGDTKRALSIGAWPRALSRVSSKPDMLCSLIRKRPEQLVREPGRCRSSRRKRKPQE